MLRSRLMAKPGQTESEESDEDAELSESRNSSKAAPKQLDVVAYDHVRARSTWRSQFDDQGFETIVRGEVENPSCSYKYFFEAYCVGSYGNTAAMETEMEICRQARR